MKININQIFNDYELIDCGDGEKLERFGNKIIIRPEVSATGKPFLTKAEWQSLADAIYLDNIGTGGKWSFFNTPFDSWEVMYSVCGKPLKIRLQLSSFKHVGVFPEQAINWNFIAGLEGLFGRKLQILNLFGYTGVASLVAAGNGHRVTHVDALKQVVQRGKTMMVENNLDGIRWITDDVLRFVAKEQKRGNSYEGVILDPPAIGKGPGGEIWKLEKHLEPLLAEIRKILGNRSFVIINLYTQIINQQDANKLVSDYFPDFVTETSDRLLGESRFGSSVDYGIVVRLFRK